MPVNDLENSQQANVQDPSDAPIKTKETTPTSSKPGMVSKLKGEFKILQGKVTKSECKLEEGRKLKLGH